MCAKNAEFCARGCKIHEKWHISVPRQSSERGIPIPLSWTQKGRPMGGVSHRSKQGTCTASSRSAPFPWCPLWGLRAPNPLRFRDAMKPTRMFRVDSYYPNERKVIIMKEHTKRMEVRVTPQEKQKIVRIADRCGLSVSEYIRQRCLGYAPRELPTEDLYWICDYLRDCKENGIGLDNESIENLIHDIRTLLILPGRDL